MAEPALFDHNELLAIAAEAAARMIVCAPTAQFGNTSGAAAEWIGIALEAHRDMPRLDTPEILATATGDTLRDAARAAGMTVGGSSKALRGRLAGHAEAMTLPGSAFAAPAPKHRPAASGFNPARAAPNRTIARPPASAGRKRRGRLR